MRSESIMPTADYVATFAHLAKRQFCTCSLALAIVIGLAAVSSLAEGQTITQLYAFRCSDGNEPAAGVIRDAAGNLYGTTSGGGASGAGTVFKLDRKGKEFSVLYSFTGGADGASPNGGLIRDNAGNFYGTTSGGGHLNNGTVFKLDGIGKETVLYRFRGGADGSVPSGGVIRDNAGNFYGSRHGSITPWPLSASPRCFEYHLARREQSRPAYSVTRPFPPLPDKGSLAALLWPHACRSPPTVPVELCWRKLRRTSNRW